jgi:hypothetical protein
MDPARIPPLLPSNPAQSHPTVAAVQDDSSVTGSFLADSEEDPTVPRPHSARKEAVEDRGDVRRGGAWGQRYEGGAARGGGLGRDGGSGVVLDKLSLALSSASLGVVSEPNTDTGTASQASSSPSAMSSTRPPTHTSDSPLQPPRDNPRVYSSTVILNRALLSLGVGQQGRRALMDEQRGLESLGSVRPVSDSVSSSFVHVLTAIGHCMI